MLSEQINATLTFIKLKVPKFQIVDKEKSFLMKVLNKFLFFMPFMEYTTTLGWTVYHSGGLERVLTSTDEEKRHFIAVILHEYIHMRRRQKWGFVYNLIYLSPQIFALLGVLAFISSYFLFALLFLAPIPSPGRAFIEFEGYCTTAAVYQWMGIVVPMSYLIGGFTNFAYYLMWPFKRFLNKCFTKFMADTRLGIMTDDLREIKEMMLAW